MANDYLIFVDGGCDVDNMLISDGSVSVLPTRFTVNGVNNSYTGLESDKDIDSIYDRQHNGDVIVTYDLCADEFETYIGQRLKHGVGVLYLTISSTLSTAYGEALKYKKIINHTFSDVPFEIIDTKTISGGIGVIAEQAVLNKKSGLSLKENSKNLKDFIKKVRSWYFIDNTKYLKETGKITNTAIFFSSALKIKPIFEIVGTGDGDFHPVTTKIGTRGACNVLVDLFFKYDVSKDAPVYINHSNSMTNAMLVKNMLEKAGVKNVIKIRPMTPMVGAHCGPGVISIHVYEN